MISLTRFDYRMFASGEVDVWPSRLWVVLFGHRRYARRLVDVDVAAALHRP
jgi:hypothetical protein